LRHWFGRLAAVHPALAAAALLAAETAAAGARKERLLVGSGCRVLLRCRRVLPAQPRATTRSDGALGMLFTSHRDEAERNTHH
jgi:hypothetical protein